MHHFKDILELQNFLHKTDRRSYLSALWSQLYPGWYTWVNSSKAQGKAGRIVPIDLGAYLYRGQVKKHNSCYPTIFRRNKASFDRLISLLKLAEFRLLCLTHLGVQRCIEFGLDVDFVGLAQHYGLDTNYLDLTQHIDIACFFAVSTRNDKGFYEPFESNSRGVIYRICHTHAELRNRIVLIGKQPFPRPEKQKAWALEMKEFEDFDKLGGIEAFTFDHTSEGAYSIWQQFNDELYPFDIIVDKAQEIKESDTIYRGIFDIHFENFVRENTKGSLSIQNFYELINSQETYKISDAPVASFAPEELKALSLEWEKYGKDFLQKVGGISYSEGIQEFNQ